MWFLYKRYGGINMNDLIGKTVEIKFDTGGHYKITYLENNQLKWTSLGGSDEGETDTVNVYYHKISDGRYSVNWIEANGDSVSQTIDLNENMVWLFHGAADETAFGGRKIFTSEGSIAFVNDDLTPDTTPFTDKEKGLDFWNKFFNEHDASAIDEYLAPPYTQHNPHVADGIEAFRNYFVPAFKGDLKGFTSDVKYANMADDKLFIHNLIKVSPDDLGTVSMDIFRFEDGKIVEHWDIQQPFPESAANPHPMF